MRSFYNLYSPNITRVFKYTTRWLGQVECMGERKGVQRVVVGNLSERECLEDHEEAILKLIVRKLD
jgi:hypothetical protein